MYMGDVEAAISLNSLCAYMYRYYGERVIILLDEYDTPMQEAYINGYWDEFTSFIRNLLNATFKTNTYLMRWKCLICRMKKKMLRNGMMDFHLASIGIYIIHGRLPVLLIKRSIIPIGHQQVQII